MNPQAGTMSKWLKILKVFQKTYKQIPSAQKKIEPDLTTHTITSSGSSKRRKEMKTKVEKLTDRQKLDLAHQQTKAEGEDKWKARKDKQRRR